MTRRSHCATEVPVELRHHQHIALLEFAERSL
jgi:hypothetical protein